MQDLNDLVLFAAVEAFEPGAAVTPSITSVSIKGHTAGHVGYRIVSGSDRLLDIGDAAHSSIVSLAKPDWTMGFDADHEAAKASRRETLGELAKSRELIFAPHFPYPGIFEGLHMELAPKYLTEAYIQHNPNVPSGRAAFVDVFSKRGLPKAIEARVQAPLVSIVAERNLVILVFAREYPDPKDNTQKYTTTWFDMFRIENGRIAEHWDPALKR